MTVAVHLLTGFLGSGKTTLLRRLLADPAMAGTAVLINEFGEVGLDHLLVEAVDEDIVLLQSGCVCCSIRGDLKDGLQRLMGRAASGAIPTFTRVIIETTGIADPVPIIASFRADPALRWHFHLAGVVTVVDAVNGLANLDAHDEVARQIAAADRLVIGKADLVDHEGSGRLRAALASLNPTAEVQRSDQPLPLADEADAATLARAVPEGRHHGHGYTTFTLNAEAPLDWAAFGLWLSMLLHRHGDRILRLKGLLHVAGSPQPVVIQGVQHLVHPPSHLPAWPDGEPATRLVVIGRDLDVTAIRRSFAAFSTLGRVSAQPEPATARPASPPPNPPAPCPPT